MQPQSNSKSISQASSFKSFPPCINKKEARMVCLNEECKDYAFFCLLCEDQSCESIHRHINKADKLEAIGFKQFIRRVLKQKKPVEELETAISSYRQTLLKLKEVVNQFVQRELKRITDIYQKTTEVPEDIFPTIKKLKQQQYQGLMGNQMDYLWKNCGESQQSIQSQHQTASFLHENEQAVKELTQAFEKMNKWEIERAEKKEGQYQSSNNKAPTQSNSYPRPNNNASGNRGGYQT